jgi:hypothetical protein
MARTERRQIAGYKGKRKDVKRRQIADYERKRKDIKSRGILSLLHNLCLSQLPSKCEMLNRLLVASTKKEECTSLHHRDI